MSFSNRTLLYILTQDGVLKAGRALDLGCENGYDAQVLAKNGYDVDAVDMNEEKIKQIPTTSSVHPFCSRIETFEIKRDEYNLVSCQGVLHFLSKETEYGVIVKMIEGAKPGGVISFNILGERDEWKGKWITWTREEIEELLLTLPIKLHKVITEEGMGMTRAGTMKYWHVLNFILIKN